MPKKKSVKRSAEAFQRELGEVGRFIGQALAANHDRNFRAAIFDYAVIRICTAFEQLMQDALVGVINNDTATISSVTGVSFPRHLTDEVCDYIITGGSFFNVRDRDDLLRRLQQFVPSNCYLVETVRDARYRAALDRLWPLRNFAAHRSPRAKKSALRSVGVQNMSSAWAWLMRPRIRPWPPASNQNRLLEITSNLEKLAEQLKTLAPY